MECMEEGYIAKIIHGDGAKEIKVGEVHVLYVELPLPISLFVDETLFISSIEAINGSRKMCI